MRFQGSPIHPALAALAVAALALAALPTHAGTAANPEIDDAPDDVDVNNRCTGADPTTPCPSQSSLWPGADLDYAYVTDTADAVLMTIGLRSAAGFKQASTTETVLEMGYGYTFVFTAKGKTYGATANYPHGGPIAPGGAATGASVDSAGKELTLTVPKAKLNLGLGDTLTNLFLQVSGLGANGFTVADRAPNTGFGRAYTIASGPAASVIVQTTLTGATPSITQAFSEPTNATYIYRWTSSAADDLEVAYDLGVEAGSLDLRIANSVNRTLLARAFDASEAGNLTVEDADGALTITLHYKGFNGTVALSFGAPLPSNPDPGTSTTTTQGPTTSVTGGPGTTAAPSTNPAGGGPAATDSGTSASTSSTSPKKTPALGAVALLAVVALALVRRRL